MKKGWELKRLDEVCTFINGRAYKKNELLSKGKYPVLRVGNFFTNNHWYYSDLELPIDKYCENGDLLYAWSASFGPRIWTGEKVIYHYHIWKVVPNINLITKEFLFLLLDWDTEKIKNDQGTGTTMMHVGKGSMDARIVPIPPLSEQQRIVAILDEAFAAIDQAKANAEQNLKNAKELFESYLQGVFEKKGEGWEEKVLGEVASFSQGIQVGLEEHLKEPKTGYVRFIRIVDYTQNTDDIRYIPNPGEKYFVTEDDIVMVRYGTPGLIGRGKAGVIANNLFKITIETNELSNDFLCLYLSQKHIQAYLSTQGSATMPALNFGQLKIVIVNYPSLKAQQTIVQKLDALSAETKKLETIYQTKIKNLEELKKSVLQKAFSGQLKTISNANRI